jgi:predicted dehydrogenase
MNRLQFLKLMSTAFAASAFAPQLLAASVGEDDKRADDKAASREQGLKADVSRPVTVVVLGAGQRGNVYASYAAEFPTCMQVVGVADINPIRQKAMGDKHNIPANRRFGDWSEAIAAGKIADAVVISLPDDLHYEPCMKALELGYDVLLEKPVAPTEAECTAIRDKANEKGAIVGVCHVLRYAPYFIAMKQVIDSGAIGELMSIQHLEPIQYAHMAHSYVRGNWHNSKQCTPIILAKSCHDLDILRWMVGSPCKSVSAYGNLRYFTHEHRPADAPDRCTDGCPHESTCPYSAIDIYVRKNNHPYVFDNLPKQRGEARDKMLTEYLRTTDYGRCVFAMDNDQPDHYVCNMLFENGVTAAFSMEAFMAHGGRRTQVMGTLGEIVGDMKKFVMTDFRTGKTTEWDATTVREVAAYAGHGHGGGDLCLARDFVNAVGHKDPSYLTSDINVSIESHLMGFAAERSRLNGTKETV